MRTEVKIGIVVGFVVIVGASVFYFNQRNRDDRTVSELPLSGPRQAADNTSETPEISARPPTHAGRTPAEHSATPDRSAPRVRTPSDTGPRISSRTPSGPDATTPRGAGPTAGGNETTADTARPGTSGADETLAPAPSVRTRLTPGQEDDVGPFPPDSGLEQPDRTALGPGRETTPGPLDRSITPPVVPPPRTRTPDMSSGTDSRTGSPPRTRLSPPGETRPKTHTVVEGDTYWGLAEHYYGDGKLYPRIIEANPDKRMLQVGQVIVIPPAPAEGQPEPEKPAERRAETGSTTTPDYRYVVEQGDSLWRIAEDQLGNGRLWPQILEANRDVLEKPEDLKVGMKLRIPKQQKD
jgi:nucleoid-associated protein YgaU